MHQTAMDNAKQFFDCYAPLFPNKRTVEDELHSKVRVVDIGAQDVNGSLRSVCPAHFEYIGVDFQQAKGVDVVLTDPYSLPFEDESVDIIVSSSCLEHSEMFWLVYLEILRVLKPFGVFYLNVPSQGQFHRYPVDCWRFYPDSGRALAAWGKRSGYNSVLLESYTQVGGAVWCDHISIFLKDEQFASQFKHKIIDKKQDFENGQTHVGDEILNPNFNTPLGASNLPGAFISPKVNNRAIQERMAISSANANVTTNDRVITGKIDIPKLK